MASTMPKGEAGRMSREDFLIQLKREYCSEKDLMEITNEFQNLKKGEINVSQYATTLMEMMELVPYLTPTKQSKVERFANGLPMDFGPMVNIATTLEKTIRVAKSLEDIAKEITIDKVEVGRKRKNEESSKSNKRNMLLEPSPSDMEPGGNKAKWCKEYGKKYFKQCKEKVTYYKYGRNSHYSNNCMYNHRICYACGVNGHISQDCPRKKEMHKN